MIQKEKEFSITAGKNAKTLAGIAESMNGFIRSQNLGLDTFGKRAIMNVDAAQMKGIIKSLADKAFEKERVGAAENAGLNTNQAINVKVRNDIAESSRKEFVARGENFLIQSQHSGGVLSNITTYQQLYLTALIQGVVQPVYSKIFKTIVDPAPIIMRSISFPKIIDHKGNVAPMIDVINDNKKILEMTSGAGANIRFSIPVTGQKIELNILDEYNRQLGTAKKAHGPRNYINRGWEILSMVYDVNGTDKEVPIHAVSMENHTQSGEISNSVGAINTTLYSTDKTAFANDIDIYGRILQNGDTKITVTDPKVKSLKIKFNLPPVGVQNPYTIQHVNAKYQKSIEQNAKASCTLNEMFLDDHVFYVGKDALELFSTDVLEITTAQKDAFTLDKVDRDIEELRKSPNQPFVNSDSYHEGATRKGLFEDVLDMNVAAETLRLNDASTTANNLMLAQRLFKLLNKIDIFMNPKERNFTLYSASAGVQWMKDAYGNNVSKFNIVGNAGNEIAGISTLYDVIRCNVGELYNVNYVATNRKRVKEEVKTNADYPNIIPAGKKAKIESLDIYINPAFEDTKDTYLMVSGKEYLTEGTGTAEDPASPSLNYQHRFDLLQFNKVFGLMKFTELPNSFVD